MRIVTFLLWLLLLGYAILLGIVSWADWHGRQFNEPDGGNRSGFNPRFAPGSYQTPEKFPLLFPPNAHLALAEQAAVDANTEAARRHAFEALRYNPASGEAALMLLDLYARPRFYYSPPDPDDAEDDTADNDPIVEDEVEDTNDNDSAVPPDPLDLNQRFLPLLESDQRMANRLALVSYRLRPTYLVTLGTLADYWTAHGDLRHALPIWSDLLINHRGSSTEAFPLFHDAFENPAFADILATYLEKPPAWWPEFFNYLLKNEPDAQKIQRYFLARTHSGTPPSAAERDSYVNHLSKQGHWQLAYEVWADSLAEQAGEPDQLFDGDFEDTQNVNQAFTWKIASTPKTVRIQQSIGTSVKGKQALHVTFRKGAKNSTHFQHVSQLRMLPSGRYQLQGHYRLNQLLTPKGLRWRVYCGTDSPAALLAESEAFKGHTSEWREFNVDMKLTTDCPVQLFRLESDSQYAHHNTFTGEIWFDNMRLTPVMQQDKP